MDASSIIVRLGGELGAEKLTQFDSVCALDVTETPNSANSENTFSAILSKNSLVLSFLRPLKMATRNFYECSSVAAQLLWSLFHGQPETACYAAYELIDSEESDLLFAYLTLAWWLHKPLADGIQKARFEAFLTRDPLRFLQTLLPTHGLHTDLPPISAMYVLPPPSAEPAEAPPLAWSVWPSGWNQSQAGKYWRAVNESLRKGNFRRPTFLTVPFSNETHVLGDLFKSFGIPNQLLEAIETTCFQPLIPYILEHCFAILAIPSTTVSSLHVRSLIPRQGGRCFRICEDALYEWGVTLPALARLRGSPILVTDSDATTYWKKAVASVKERGFNPQKPMLFEDSTKADVVEDFYATYFPYDIPEEWIRTEKEKSHFEMRSPRKTTNPWILAFCV